MLAPDAPAEIRLILSDAEGAPVDGARVEVEAFHHAHRNDAVTTILVPEDSGRYTLALDDAPAGLWQVRLRAVSDAGIHLATRDVFTKNARG